VVEVGAMDALERGIVERAAKVQPFDLGAQWRVEWDDLELAGNTWGNDSRHGWLPA
jgi:hypothetical protein